MLTPLVSDLEQMFRSLTLMATLPPQAKVADLLSIKAPNAFEMVSVQSEARSIVVSAGELSPFVLEKRV